MASYTGIPASVPDIVTDDHDDPDAGESQPLLGRPGDVMQRPTDSLFKNLGTGKQASVHTGQKSKAICSISKVLSACTKLTSTLQAQHGSPNSAS